MGSWQTSGRLMIIILASIGLYLGFNLGSIFLIDPREHPTLFIVVTVLGCLGFGIGVYLAVRWAIKPPRYREAEKIGLLVQCRIVECAPTGWKHKRSRGFSNRIVESEYKLQVEIKQPNHSNAQRTIYGYFGTSSTPRKGQYVSLKIHPRYPKIVVLAKTAKE